MEHQYRETNYGRTIDRLIEEDRLGDNYEAPPLPIESLICAVELI